MATVEITVALAKEDKQIDKTKSIETASVTPTEITTDMKIVNALGNKNNSLVIGVVASTAGSLIIKAGNRYPNKILGDLSVPCVKDKFTVIRLQDISRFENKDDSVTVIGDGTLAGTILATAKRAGIMPVLEQDAADA
jgi:hypothetical protein